MLITRPFFDLPIVRRSNALRTFLAAAWLGWQIESNWTDPVLFAIYSFARPIASVLILVVMYNVITNGATGEPIFAYIYLGNALYILVGQVLSGVGQSVVEDRERYRTMKQLYTTPLNGYYYLMGRGVARLLIGTVSVIITLVFGIVVFKLPLNVATIDWPLFVASTIVGILSLAALGAILGATTMMVGRNAWSIGEATAGALYLFAGAIFPLDVLPTWLRPIGFIFPVTYWLELARRALLGPNAARFPTLSGFSNTDLMAILVVMTLALLVVSRVYYRWAFHQAQERGLIDIDTSF
jgi:ABC-2 type transport system permease protein